MIPVQARIRLCTIGPLCLIAVIILAVTIVSYSVTLYKLDIEKKEKENEYIRLQEESDYLKTEIEKLQDPEYLAKFARENYSYSKDGELIIKIDDSKNEVSQVEEKMIIENEKIMLYCAIGIALIFIYIILKSFRHKKDS